jgi:chromosomal replication initiator protein
VDDYPAQGSGTAQQHDLVAQGEDLLQAWDGAVQALVNVAPMRDRAFLMQARPVGLVDGTVVVMVPNQMTKQELEQRSAEPLAQALSASLGRDVVLSVSVLTEKPDLSPNTAPDQPVDPASAANTSWESEQRPDDRHVDSSEAGPRGSSNGFHSQARRPMAFPSSASPGKPTRLNPRYTFDNFVIGPSNRFAHAAAVAAAEAPGKAYNPLLIYGESGLGKTHLLHAIGHYAQHLYEGAVVRYGSSEEFTNEFINSIRDDKSRSFQQIYRNVDLLLIDDIQFLEGKEQTQEEFFHTFNTLHNANKQIVITSDRPPKELANLEDRLRNRFSWGLLTDVQPPDLETRIAILSKRANADHINVPGEVLEVIAGRITRNIRELEGALVRVAALANLQGQAIDAQLATEALRDLVVDDSSRSVAPELIMRITADFFDFDLEDLVGTSRKQPLATSRQIAMYLCRELTDLSLPRIGEVFGGRDHTTVMHAQKVIRKKMNENRGLYDQMTELTSRIKQASRRP